MAKSTGTKLSRMFEKAGRGDLIKRSVPLPSSNRTLITFEHRGVVLSEMVSPGQCINKERAYKRFMKKKKGN